MLVNRNTKKTVFATFSYTGMLAENATIAISADIDMSDEMLSSDDGDDLDDIPEENELQTLYESRSQIRLTGHSQIQYKYK